MKRYARTVILFAITLTKRFFRDPVAMFFTFLFPLLFLFVFGFIFKGGDVSFDVAVINNSNTEFSRQFVEQLRENKNFKINDDVTSLDRGKELMGRGELDSILELPQDFGVPAEDGVPTGKLGVFYKESSPDVGAAVGSIMKGTLDAINVQLTQVQPPFTVEQKPTQTANLSQFDYTFSGLIGFSIMSLGIFGLANGFPADKKAGILRRLRATPLTAGQLIGATALEYLFIGALSVLAMVLVGVFVFGFDMRGDWLTFAAYCVIGIVMMFGIGLAIGGWAKNENQSAPLSNLVSFPMMFLSGAFIPRFIMPEFLQAITVFVPLTPVIDGLRLIMTENASLLQLGPQVAVIGVWMVLIYALAIRIFRWE